VTYVFRSAFPLANLAVYVFETACELIVLSLVRSTWRIRPNKTGPMSVHPQKVFPIWTKFSTYGVCRKKVTPQEKFDISGIVEKIFRQI